MNSNSLSTTVPVRLVCASCGMGLLHEPRVLKDDGSQAVAVRPCGCILGAVEDACSGWSDHGTSSLGLSDKKESDDA